MTAFGQLLRDAMAEHTDGVPHLRPGTARTVLRRSHRSSRVRLVAATTATVAATAGVGAFAVSLQPRTSAMQEVGSGPAPATAPATAASQTPGDSTTTDAPTPDAPVTLYGAKLSGTAPAALSPVSMPVSVAGFAVGSVELTQADMGATGVRWVKMFGLSRPGSSLNDINVTIVAGSDLPFRNPSSPAPTTSPVAVLGHPATDWTSGGDHEVYFTAGQLTVELSGGPATTAQLVAVGDAISGLPQ